MSRLLVLPIALALLLVACGGAASDADLDRPSDADSDSDETSAAGDSGDGETLSDFLGDGFDWEDDPEAAEAHYRQQEADVQEHIRQCMVEQGFEYTPVQPPESAITFSSDSEDEWRQTMGFGITTWVGNEDAVGDEEWIDPNQELVEAMSETEQEAYSEALYGNPEDQESVTETDPDTGEEFEVYTGFGGGCSGEAYAEVYGDPEAEQEVWEQLEPALEQLNTRVEADPRIVEANAAWSACMAEAGYDYESPNAMHEVIFDEFQGRLEEITGPGGGYPDPFEGMTEAEIDAFFEEKTQEEIDAFFADEQRKTMESIDQEALTALQQEEIDLAATDAECGADNNDLYQEVYEEYEVEMVAENRELLEQLRGTRDGS